MVDMKPFSLRGSTVPALLLGLSLGGCPTGKSTIGLLDDGDDTGTSTGSSNDDESGSDESATTVLDADADPSASTGSSSGGELPRSCPPDSPCSQPLACVPEGFEPCGSILSNANEDGCPRPYCSGPGECPAGSSCFLPHSWGQCGLHGCWDNEELGMCECGFGLDCNNDGLCVPHETGLPPDTNATDFCGQHTDATACEASGMPAELGLCLWYEGWEVPADGACEERVPTGRCTFSRASLSGGIDAPTCPGDDSLTPLAYVDDGTITVLFVDPQDPPTALEMDFDVDSYGWLGCDQPEVADACACACE